MFKDTVEFLTVDQINETAAAAEGNEKDFLKRITTFLFEVKKAQHDREFQAKKDAAQK